MGRAEPSHLPLWFEQQDWKTVAPQSSTIGVPQEDMRVSGQPQAHDSISVGSPGAGDVTQWQVTSPVAGAFTPPS